MNGESSPPNPDHEQDLSRLYRLAQHQQPPIDLDRKILSTARREVDRFHLGSPFAGGWKVPVSMAAVLVIGLTVLFQLEDRGELIMPAESLAPGVEMEKPSTDYDAPVRPHATDIAKQYPHDKALQTASLEDGEIGSEKVKPAPTKKTFEYQAPPLRLPDETRAPGPAARQPLARPKHPTAAISETTRPGQVQQGDIPSLEPPKTPSTGHAGQSTVQQSGTMRQSAADEWFIRIQQLVHNGDFESARRELTKFRLAHPEYPVEELMEILF